MGKRHGLGREAEAQVADHLIAAGFEILARNVRLGPLELDIVARRDELAVIVEVRTRGAASFQGPLESVTPQKRARIVRGAERLWRERLSKIEGIERLRFDVAAVTFDAGAAHVEYIEGAFTA
jgi:putative endonuclease